MDATKTIVGEENRRHVSAILNLLALPRSTRGFKIAGSLMPAMRAALLMLFPSTKAAMT